MIERTDWTLIVSDLSHSLVFDKIQKSYFAVGLAPLPLGLPLSLLDLNAASADLGVNGTTYFSFNTTFSGSGISVPLTGSVNSGTIDNVDLTQGPLGTLVLLIQNPQALDVISSSFSIT